MPVPGSKFQFDGARLRAARETAGFSREIVAVQAGCSASLVALAELGYRRPAPETLAAIAHVVGIVLDDLFVTVEPAV